LRWAIRGARWDNNNWAWNVVVIVTASQDTAPEVDDVAANISGTVGKTADQVANKAGSCACNAASNVCGNG
jgi:hypothetical protein